MTVSYTHLDVYKRQLSRGSMVSDSEQDKIITPTMNDLNITRGMLLNAKSMLDAAHKLEGFGMKDVENALLKLTGAQDAVELYKLVMGENVTSAQIAQKIAQDQIKGEAKDFVQNQLEDALTHGGTVALQGMGKYGFKLLFLLPDLTEIGVNALTKYENIEVYKRQAVPRTLAGKRLPACRTVPGCGAAFQEDWGRLLQCGHRALL